MRSRRPWPRVIRAEAPVRICDLGGWTDTWFAEHGAVCSIAVTPGSGSASARAVAIQAGCSSGASCSTWASLSASCGDGRRCPPSILRIVCAVSSSHRTRSHRTRLRTKACGRCSTSASTAGWP